MSSYREEVNVLKNKIQKADIVSFDVFDTLLLRNVLNPTDIFKAVEIDFFKENCEEIDFFKIRIRAEHQARKHSRKEDVLLDEIYQYVEKELGPVSNKLKKLEIELEKKFITANGQMKELYNYAKTLDKRIFIITDMYMPKSIIEELLSLNDIDGYEKLFVSSELKITKATGSLYQHIKFTEQINNESEWLHIGDNYQSDVINAEKFGITAYHYKKLNDRENVQDVKNLGESIVKAIQINNKYSSQNEYWYIFGNDYVAPIYIGLMMWLVDSLKNKNNIYFLARDGYLPYQLYLKMKSIYPELPEGRYIYASRRGYIYPYLLKVSRESAIETLMLYNSGLGQKLTLKEILENIGLFSDKYKEHLGMFEIKSLETEVNNDTRINIARFLDFIWKDIEQVLQHELRLLLKYLEQIRMNSYETINIFDIGWSGSTQLAIKRLLNKKVTGYYFATIESIHSEIKKDSFGYACDQGFPMKSRKFIIENVMIYELIFSAPEGSLINFRIADNRVVPNLKDVEQNKYMIECVQSFQQGVLDVFDQVFKYDKYIDNVSVTFALKGMEDFIKSYKAIDMLQFSKLTNSVGFGMSSDVKKYVSIISLKDYLENRKLHIRNGRQNLWKNAILILDEQGRYFNKYEVDKLYNIYLSNISLKISNVLNFLIKVIKNPEKVIYKIIQILKNAFWKLKKNIVYKNNG